MKKTVLFFIFSALCFSLFAADKKAKLDFDDDFGKEIFEVEFKVGSTEYEYKIDPKTGDIIVEKIETDD